MEIKKTHLNNNFKHICENCSFYSNNNNDFNRHIFTAKHKNRVFGNKNKFLEIEKKVWGIWGEGEKKKKG